MTPNWIIIITTITVGIMTVLNPWLLLIYKKVKSVDDIPIKKPLKKHNIVGIFLTSFAFIICIFNICCILIYPSKSLRNDMVFFSSNIGLFIILLFATISYYLFNYFADCDIRQLQRLIQHLENHKKQI